MSERLEHTSADLVVLPRAVENSTGNRQQATLLKFADDVAAGLSGKPKHLPCKYLYDEEGSRLFREIMELEEYYPTGCEAEIIERHKGQIADLVGTGSFNLVELGAGDGAKTRILLRCFLDMGLDLLYIPIDISDSAIRGLTADLNAHFRDLPVHGLITEYFEGLEGLARLNRRRNLVLFLGSNIGNFTPSEVGVFLSSLWAALSDGDLLLIGFDLKKEVDTLLRAYNDAKGVTARFNTNVLRRINDELEGDFDLNRFEYYSTYDPRSASIESFLMSTTKQTVHVGRCRQSFSFGPWEPIHTESSRKFLTEDLTPLARENGFQPIASFFDSRRYFVDMLWQVKKAC